MAKHDHTQRAASLPDREDEQVEFKQEWTKNALEDLAAFANHKGGTLYIGVRDDGSPLGVALSDAELQVIVNQVTDVLGIRPTVSWQGPRGQDVLAIRVQRTTTPVPCRGRYLTRVGSTNREMAPEQIARLFMNNLGQTWDALPSRLSVRAVSKDAIRHFLSLARASKRLPPDVVSDSPSRVLENLGLLREGHLTNAGVLLFAERPQALVAQAQVHVGRFKDDKIADDRLIWGTLWNQLDQGLAALRTYLLVALDVAPVPRKKERLKGLQHQERWEYPYPALREALVNALIHRDYTALGDIEVRVHDEDLGIWSPGGLPKGIHLQDLRKRRHISRPRNPNVAKAFFLAGIIEHWGTGTTRIIEECQKQDLPEPEFAEEMGGFAVRFLKNPYTPEKLQALGLNERQIAALLHLKKVGTINNSAYRTLNRTSARTAAADLTDLVRRSLLVPIGRARALRYRAKIAQIAQ